MPDDATIDFVIAFISLGLLALGIGSVLLGWLVRLWDRVRGLEEEGDSITSSNGDGDPQNTPLSLQTRQQTDSRPPVFVTPSRDVMLDTYRRLRKYGMPREEARVMLKSLSLPLDNNLWTAAAPTGDEHITPIAGRRTQAQFEAEPELRYEAPPR